MAYDRNNAKGLPSKRARRVCTPKMDEAVSKLVKRGLTDREVAEKINARFDLPREVGRDWVANRRFRLKLAPGADGRARLKRASHTYPPSLSKGKVRANDLALPESECVSYLTPHLVDFARAVTAKYWCTADLEAVSALIIEAGAVANPQGWYQQFRSLAAEQLGFSEETLQHMDRVRFFWTVGGAGR